MERAPLVSVIVPIYNIAGRLPACLESLRAQTLTDFECILVDDGSTDESGAICDEFAASFPAARVVHKPNGGLSSARNAGLDVARGRYVAFLDADDELAPRTLECAAATKAENPEALIWWEFTRDPELYARACADQPQWELTRRSLQQSTANYTMVFIFVTGKLLEGDFIARQGLRFNEELGRPGFPGEDLDFMNRYISARWAETDFPVVHIKTPLYYYYDNPNSLSNVAVKQADAPDPPEAGYCARLQREYAALFEAQPDLLEGDLGLVGSSAQHYLRCLAFGIWSARELGEPLARRDWDDEMLRRMLRFCKANHIFVPYYIPFRLGSAAFIRRFYAWDRVYSIWYYRFKLLFQLLLRGWREPRSFKK